MAEYGGAYSFGEEPDTAPSAAPQPMCCDTAPSSSAAPAPSSSPAPPAAVAGGVLLVRSTRLAALSRLLPVNQDRVELVHDLLEATGLLDGVTVEEAPAATIEELREYHSLEYLSALAHWQRLRGPQRAAFGLQDDCSPFPGLYEYAALCAGGSLRAARALCAGACRTAVHLEGGRHHAQKSLAAGFCYVNDVVLAVLCLLGSFRRVLYVDVDIHHCDAVQQAFDLTDRVITASLHKHEPGFFPGTGPPGGSGQGRGAGCGLNLPLRDGVRDGTLLAAFQGLAGGAVRLARPDCVVLQCGVDGLAGDPVGRAWSCTPRGYAACAAEAASWGLPLLVLGGGGYSSPATACAWAAVVAALQGRELPEDIPGDCEHLDRYAPSYQIHSICKPALAPDRNSPEQVALGCAALLAALEEGLGTRQRASNTGAA